jgi:hypothetical protein
VLETKIIIGKNRGRRRRRGKKGQNSPSSFSDKFSS